MEKSSRIEKKADGQLPRPPADQKIDATKSLRLGVEIPSELISKPVV